MNNYNISNLYNKQLYFQQLLGNENIPTDNPQEMAHHLLGLITEVGEVAQADKRWKKNKRNKHYDKIEKVNEIADCFIFLLNVCIYSDVSPDDLLKAVSDKIEENISRFKESEEINDYNS